MWCGVLCQRRCYQMAMAGMVLHTGNASREGCMSKCAVCVVCWNSFCALSHCPGAVGSGISPVRCLTALGQWAVELRLCTAYGQWAGELVLCTASLPVGSGQWNLELLLCTAL